MWSMLSRAVKRLSYAEARPALAFLAGLAVAVAASVYVYTESLEYAASLENYTSDEIYYVDVARRMLVEIFGVEGEWWPYSGKTREDYLNTEHPPLGKYIIAASMVLCGDEPVCWRMPGILEAAAIPVILYIGYFLGGSRLAGPWPAAAAGAAAAAAAAADKILVEEAAIAMLDIHLAFFTALAVAAAAAGRVRLSLAAAATASAVKYSGVFVVPAAAVAAVAWGWSRRRAAAEAIVLLIAVQATAWAPLVLYKGDPLWVFDELLGAAKWHTTPRDKGPPSSPPWLWAFNHNPSKLSYNPYLGGEVTTTLHLAGAVAAALSVAAAPRKGYPAPGAHALIMLMLGYTSIYIAGNTTLYSFYAVHLTPTTAASLADAALIPAVGSRAGRPG